MDANQLFEVVYREKAILIYCYLCSIGCPPQDVEDIIQETFVKALINIDSFRGVFVAILLIRRGEAEGLVDFVPLALVADEGFRIGFVL